jgi:hypothetical protein
VKRIVLGLIVGLAVGIASTSLASGNRFLYLNRGDAAVSNGGETTCKASPHGGSRLGFICQVGGDYRARYGVIVNEKEVDLIQFSHYTNFTGYKIVVHRDQNPVR